ncbi:MAG: hypothetical protein RLZZ316_1521 [Bacteroidota bacterium]
MKKAGIFFLVFFFGITVQGFSQNQKPRVIAMTDGEVDDRCSMVRLLLHTNDIELLGIIQTNSVYQRKGWVADKWLDKQVDAYEQIYPNLVIHDPNYPRPDVLRSKLFVGDNDSAHITVDFNSPARIPGQKPAIDPSAWNDTEGSDKIVKILLEKDPRKVHIQAWGGGNTAAKAFYKLKAQYPKEYKRAVSKVVMYNIWYQDGAGSYIEQNHPEVTMLLSHHFSGTWDYNSQVYTHEFITNYVKSTPLGKLYPQDYISEGDNPSFLYSLSNGLRSDENPTYGGWGGRFYKIPGFQNVYRDADKGSYVQWIETANRDFAMRLKWSITPKYEGANHKPKIKLGVSRDITVKSGEFVKLKAAITDNDSTDYQEAWLKVKELFEQQGRDFEWFKNMMSRRPKTSALWWQYKDAGTYNGNIDLGYNQKEEVQFKAPNVKEKCTVHFILEAKDNGSPALTSYERVIITILP